MDRPPARLLLWLGLALIAGGWVVIYLGWNQAGRQELETGQIPFLLSGGFGGAGLLLLGAAAVVVDTVQHAAWHQRKALDEIRRAVEALSEARRRRGDEDDDDDAVEVPRGRRRRPRSAAR